MDRDVSPSFSKIKRKASPISSFPDQSSRQQHHNTSVIADTSYSATVFDRHSVRQGLLRPSFNQLTIATWNVEGLTDEKIITLQRYMEIYDIHILCLQETHKPLSNYIVTEKDFLLILSGRADTKEREFAGVGFLIAPTIRRSVYGFCQLSSRLACVKIRIPGGQLAILSCYAPHSGRDFEERLQFFQDLTCFWRSISSYGPRICMGDLNSRLYCRFAGEDDIIGDYMFQSRGEPNKFANRHLLMEFCSSNNLRIVNTFIDRPIDQQILYREFAT